MTPHVPALSLQDVRVTRAGRRVLEMPHLEVAPGETVAILGPNGAGKSTLLLAAALLLPAQGDIRIFGEQVARGTLVRLRRETATVFQDAALLDMSVRRNIEVALALHQVPRGERRERADAWLARLGVAHLAEARGHAVSGGEAQRVSLARAFAVRPRLLFLDEPFAGVDLAMHSALTGDLRSLLAAEGTAAVIATHDHSEALLLADRVVLLEGGVPLQVGPAAEVLARPSSVRAARSLGYAVLAASSWRLLGLQAPAGASHGAISADHVRLDAGGAPATVVRAEAGAGSGRLLVELESGERIAAALPIGGLRDPALAPGRTVRVGADDAGVRWLDR